MKRNIATVAGFMLFLLGFLSLILSLVGLKLDVLGFLYKLGGGFALFVHLILMIGGLSMLYVSRVGIDADPIE